jgi:hypothetical protein
VRVTPPPLYPQGKSTSYPLDRRLGGPQNLSGRGGEEKNSYPLPVLEPPIIQPVPLSCPGSYMKAGDLRNSLKAVTGLD